MSRVSFSSQAGALKSYFPESKIIRKQEQEITWTHRVTPSPLSASYVLKLHHKVGELPKIYVLDPLPLSLASGKYLLPHVYSTPKQQLCLYYPKDKEWNSSMFYVQSLIPWACEWLIHYEVWLATGEWLGGGISHEVEAEKKAQESEA
jgi:hypothetical protein